MEARPNALPFKESEKKTKLTRGVRLRKNVVRGIDDLYRVITR
jgi:hypothetical protein